MTTMDQEPYLEAPQLGLCHHQFRRCITTAPGDVAGAVTPFQGRACTANRAERAIGQARCNGETAQAMMRVRSSVIQALSATLVTRAQAWVGHVHARSVDPGARHPQNRLHRRRACSTTLPACFHPPGPPLHLRARHRDGAQGYPVDAARSRFRTETPNSIPQGRRDGDTRLPKKTKAWIVLKSTALAVGLGATLKLLDPPHPRQHFLF